MDVEVLMKKDKHVAAAYIHAECSRTSLPLTLHSILDVLLNPLKNIDDYETINWCKWLMAGECTPDEFATRVRKYDNATTCGLVWTANFVAYRCRTCGISPCMSLCAECFQRGNHKGHDFNMFRSQAGGACDCGDTNVMKEAGFCYLHGPHVHESNHPPDCGIPPDLLCVAVAMMPRLILRLIQHMRQHSNSLSGFLGAVDAADKFITMLHDMSSMGAAMRQVMTHALTNPQVYKNLTEIDEDNVSSEYYEFMHKSKRSYEEALTSLPNPEPPEEYKDIPSLQKKLIHTTFLEEFVFWTAKFEFPQKIVCLLLNLLPDADYKEAFTRAFVLHYSRISQLLVHCQNPDMLSNRVVHVSVQLFSNEKLALKMTEQMKLLHVMVISLKYMMSKITIPSTLHDKNTNSHRVVDCGNLVMKDHCYWPLVSDLNNILSHRPVALKFLEDDGLLRMWFSFLSMFQGMNVNHREMNQHVEFEPTTYYAAFSAELEASASPMWALLVHLKDATTAHLTKNLLQHCRSQLRDWLVSVNKNMLQNDGMQVSFHLPLHRYFAVFLYQGVRNQGLSLNEILPPPEELQAIIQHPLRVQSGFYEIISGLWVRNGLQIKGQAMTYIQCHFCNSMVDADLFLLQVAMMNLPAANFVQTVLEKFHILYSLSISSSVSNSHLEPDQEMLMMENCLIFISTLTSVRTSIGMKDADLVTMEMITLLCMGDKTHSQLMELMPERCGNSSQTRDFESVLAKVADYRAPNFESSGNMLQGMYVPKPCVWEKIYDPIYVLLRAVHRRDFQTSLDRFTEFAKQSGNFKGAGTPWPPYRIPELATAPYQDPRHLLISRVVQAVIFVVLYKAVKTTHLSDQMAALSVYLLEMALTVCDSEGSKASTVSVQDCTSGRYDMEFSSWFATDNLLANLKTEIDSVLVKNSVVTSGPSDDLSVNEMDIGSFDDEVEMLEAFDFDGAEPMDGHLAIMPPILDEHPYAVGQVTQQSQASQSSSFEPILQSVVSNAIISGVGAIGAQINTISGNLTRLLTNQVSSRGQEPVEGMRQIDDPRRHSRNMQLVLSSPKPVVSIQKMEIERSLSTGDSGYAVEIVLNESIISLLLKLHSKLSGGSDSYVPFWQTPEAEKTIFDAISGEENGLKIRSTSESECESQCFSYSELYEVLGKNAASHQRIGDGAFFIGHVLDLIASKDESCRDYILLARSKIWPKNSESEEEVRHREDQEKAEKRRMAFESRRKAMEKIAKDTKAFAESMKTEFKDDDMNGSGQNDSGACCDDSDLNNSTSKIKPIEYDCVICNQSSPSTASNPIGLVILLQASSALAQRRRKGSKNFSLPVNDEEREELMRVQNRMSSYNERRLVEYQSLFDDSAWLMAISGGWEGGVHVATCGHHIHHNCLQDYLNSLRSQQRQHNISIDRGEYACPLCRQLANSFLPISPEFGNRQSAVVKDRKDLTTDELSGYTMPELPPSREATISLELIKLLVEKPFPAMHCTLVDAMTRTMEEMTNATALKYRKIGSSKNTKSILLFVNSIARTNLELEIVHRGGNLVSIPSDPQPSTSAAPSMATTSVSKRSCIVPLLNVLGVHYRILSTDISPKIWESILGIRFSSDASLAKPEREVPMLLRDPCSLLLHLLMQIPVNVDIAYFTCIVQGIYNLAYIQVLAQLSCTLKEEDRKLWKSRSFTARNGDLNQLLGVVINYLDNSEFYKLDSDISQMNEMLSVSSPAYRVTLREKSNENEESIELKLQQLLLPYLRVAALIRHHIIEEDLPFISSKDEEFYLLAQFLTLGGMEINNTERSSMTKAHNFLFWIVPNPLEVLWTWVGDLCDLASKHLLSSKFLLETQHILWEQPRLLELPQAYDVVFQYYHRKQCTECKSVPKDPTMCLICGTLVCLRESCCKNSNICEATKHSIDCGAGTAIFLCVSSSTIVVIRGKRACLWGSVYLDCFGEEDRELRRGKPLFMNEKRYALLKQQWLTHRFDHTQKKWIFHRDTL